MALPVNVTLVALATKLFRVSHKHRLDCRSPGLQTQPITNGGNASIPIACAVPWFTVFNPICFVMASISSLSVCDSQPQA
jgi:hypothetical protein